MGFDTNNGSKYKLHGVRFSSLAGNTFLATAAAIAAIGAIKAEIGEKDVKTGFTGKDPSTTSGKVIQKMIDAGVQFGTPTGILSGVRVKNRDIQGVNIPYLSVTVTDGEDKYNLSVSLTQRAAQMLVRKLDKAELGVKTSFRLFSTYDKREGADRAYAEQGATLVQHGVEVKGVAPGEKLKPLVDNAVNAMDVAGITDKTIIAKQRAAVELKYHAELAATVQAKFEEYYKSREVPAAPEEEETLVRSYAGFNDMDDDIPF